jgi:hypothetical protein
LQRFGPETYMISVLTKVQDAGGHRIRHPSVS